jgi:hypothetical protein
MQSRLTSGCPARLASLKTMHPRYACARGRDGISSQKMLFERHCPPIAVDPAGLDRDAQCASRRRGGVTPVETELLRLTNGSLRRAGRFWGTLHWLPETRNPTHDSKTRAQRHRDRRSGNGPLSAIRPSHQAVRLGGWRPWMVRRSDHLSQLPTDSRRASTVWYVRST